MELAALAVCLETLKALAKVNSILSFARQAIMEK
jgi:hypothetical protein